jgi:hypothetical protein
LKAGSIKLVPPNDAINDSAWLRIEILNDDGSLIGDVDVLADALVDDDDRQAVALLEHLADGARRKADYIQRHFNRELVLNQLRELHGLPLFESREGRAMRRLPHRMANASPDRVQKGVLKCA